MKMQLVRVGVEYQTHSSQYKYYDTSILLLIPERVLVTCSFIKTALDRSISIDLSLITVFFANCFFFKENYKSVLPTCTVFTQENAFPFDIQIYRISVLRGKSSLASGCMKSNQIKNWKPDPCHLCEQWLSLASVAQYTQLGSRFQQSNKLYGTQSVRNDKILCTFHVSYHSPSLTQFTFRQQP